jgi:hypothetical protein
MNLYRAVLAAGCLLALCGAALADAGAEAPARALAARPRGERAAEAPSERGGVYVDRLLETIRTENPEEFERLSKMRERDPEQFRMELRRKLIELRRARGEGDRPPRRPRGETEPAEPGERPPRGGPGPDRPGDERGEPRRPDQEVRTLVQQYREAETAQQQKRIEGALRARLVEMHERRQTDRRARIERFEQELDRMKSDLQRLDEERDTLIERRLQELIRPRDLPVRPGRPEAPPRD